MRAKADALLCHSLNATMDEFNTAFENPSLLSRGDGDLYVDKMKLALELIKEEYMEVEDAHNTLALYKSDEEEQENREHYAKELSDLIYVCVWAARINSIDIDGAFLEVHSSNMTKLGEDGKTIRNASGKVQKGPNYREADMKAFV